MQPARAGAHAQAKRGAAGAQKGASKRAHRVGGRKERAEKERAAQRCRRGGRVHLRARRRRAPCVGRRRRRPRRGSGRACATMPSRAVRLLSPPPRTSFAKSESSGAAASADATDCVAAASTSGMRGRSTTCMTPAPIKMFLSTI